MYFTTRPAIRIKQFVENCTPNWFNVGHQQDCSEYLIFLLDNLNEEFKKLKNDKLQQNSTKRTTITTLVQNLFGFKLLTECICLNCKSQTIRVDDNNYILPLSFPPATTITTNNNNASSNTLIDLQLLVDNYFKCEELNENNLYSCSNCKSLQIAHKTIKLVDSDCDEFDNNNNETSTTSKLTSSSSSSLPTYLILTLNRFQYERMNQTNEIKNVKIMQQVNYNQFIRLNVFNRTKSCKLDNSINGVSTTSDIVHYKLAAICIHSGTSLHHGHYYSYIVDVDDAIDDYDKNRQFASSASMPNWILANDEQLSIITYDTLMSNLTKFKTDTPYLLIYEKLTENDLISNKQQFLNLSSNNKLIELINNDNKLYEKEYDKAKLNQIRLNKRNNDNYYKNNYYSNYRNRDSDDDNNNDGAPPDYNSAVSHLNDGPRFVF